MENDPRVAILPSVPRDKYDTPFGRRWHYETVTLQEEQLKALLEGKTLAIDVYDEYVVYLKLDPSLVRR